MIALEPVVLQIPLDPPLLTPPAGAPWASVELLLVRAHSGALVAYGEAASVPREDFVAAVDFLGDFLGVAEATDFDLLWQRLAWALRDHQPQPAAAYAAALSAVDAALWDLAGQALNLPCWRLLGGARSRLVDCYLTGLWAGQSDLEKQAKRLSERFGALQLRLSGDRDRDVAAARLLRRVIGDNAPLRLDGAAAYPEAEAALELSRALEPLEVFWLQDPLPPGDWAAWTRVSGQLPCALAGGRSLLSLRGADEALAAGALDVLTPDVRLAGGPSGGRRLAALAWARGAAVSFGGGPSPLGQLVALHLSAATMHAGPLEVALPREALGGLLDPALSLRDGFLSLPDGPGLGPRVSERFLERYQVETPQP